MARPLRIVLPGAIYHLTSRGNAREDIFLDDDDRRVFLAIPEEFITRYGWPCYAYCVMSNHYHHVVETTAANLSLSMRQLNGLYSQRFDRKNNSVGDVFQGRL